MYKRSFSIDTSTAAPVVQVHISEDGVEVHSKDISSDLEKNEYEEVAKDIVKAYNLKKQNAAAIELAKQAKIAEIDARLPKGEIEVEI